MKGSFIIECHHLMCVACVTVTFAHKLQPLVHLLIKGDRLQVRELAEKEKEEGLGDTFRLLQKDVTRFLTTILIGST